ncbi:MAG TPA: GDP-mannose 4,6-dehydratase [Acidobacteriaceae bacterium]
MAKQTARTILITGGAGFIGSNVAQRLLQDPSTRVRIFDNLSRENVDVNLGWLHGLDGADRLEFIKGDVRNAAAVASAARNVTEIYHFAAQVAVTTSVEDPRTDFETNVGGTLNVLEAARVSGRHPFVLFTSTNKVYGSLPRVPVEVDRTHYRAAIPNFNGVRESEPLDFHSPYGCSKGAADQYVHDYARIYELPTVVFRMSCIAGPRQFGTEDQGWVAHFLYSALEHRPITVYGDGFQVRDVLHVYDLIDAMSAVRNHLPHTAGQIYNLGGGMARSVSVVEMLEAIHRATGVAPSLRYSDVRPGDQPLYIADISKIGQHTGWQPRRSLDDTLEDIHEFWRSHRKLLHMQGGSATQRELVGEVA